MLFGEQIIKMYNVGSII